MKEPHNYRAVGIAMIVVAVSLTITGLIVWAIGDEYYFASNKMAAQETDAMTPHKGYNIVLFDHSQPVGAKLKLLDHADLIDDANNLQNQYQKQFGKQGQVVIFDPSIDDNKNLIAREEVYSMTPDSGYNVVLFNPTLSIGARLTMGAHFDVFDNATKYQDQVKQQIVGQPVQVMIFTNSLQANEKLTGDLIANETLAAPVGVNATTTTPVTSNTTAPLVGNVTSSNATSTVPVVSNATKGTNKTITLSENLNVKSSS